MKLRFRPLTKFATLAALIAVINGCTVSDSRYKINQDVAPKRLPSSADIADIKPQDIPYSRGGNKNYTVRGISYQVLKSHHGYSDTGIASWYGSKFHGHLTSNGEIYNMYGLSAAHKSLPIPSFARITNLDNNKQTIVRVNDRGPFHPDRLIDLSYGAAYKLGVLKHGTARVKVEAISVNQAIPSSVVAPTPSPQLNTTSKRCAIQLLALKNKDVIIEKSFQLQAQFSLPTTIQQVGDIYRLKLGPINSLTRCESVHKKVLNNYPKAFIKTL